MPVELLRMLFMPLLLLAGGVLLQGSLVDLGPQLQLLLAVLPYLLGGANLLLGYLFNQSRLLLSTLNLLAAYLLIQLCLQTPLARPDNFVLFSLLTLQLPVSQLLICLAPERGLRNRRRLLPQLIPLALYPILWLLWQQQLLGPWLSRLPAAMLELQVAGHYLSEGSALLCALTLLLSATVLYFRRSRSDGALFGVLLALPALFYGFDRPQISPLLFTAMQLMLSQALILHSHQLAFVDELTGIPARRALQEQLASLGRRYTLAMMDIDHFKQFNDRYGHDAGDQVLRLVASQLRRVGGGGRVFRYGGEEFTVLFRGKGESEALPHLEQLREAIAQYPLQIRQPNRPDNAKSGRQQRRARNADKPVQVTVSIGLCERSPTCPDADAVMQQADKALYAAKRAGRNRTLASQRLGRRVRHGQSDFA
ncbi:GGDEF domain-containing protein [Marinobacterium aestuariivivens]|uniref:diguanylate cyclase n=1 Tax=Marinobacterium aestuariivivens TaxID=1698799 RepID=A0ABW2A4Q2_9GAMM